MSDRYEGGDLLVESLENLGVRHIFSVSGGPLNSIYHAAANRRLSIVHARHEAAACFMAEATSRLSGIPGVAAVTLGPGVTNCVTAALAARMSGTPLLIVGGQSNIGDFDRGAEMSAEHVSIMSPVTKFAARVLSTERIPEYLEAAWRLMWSGRPGPVFLEIPIDVLAAGAEPQAPAAGGRRLPGLEPGDAAAIRKALAAARRPLVVIGDEVCWELGRGLDAARLAAALERHGLPFAPLRLGRGAVDERHPLCCGLACVPANATFRTALKEADLVLLLGHHLECDLDYGRTIRSDAVIVQCCADPEHLGRNRQPTVAALSALAPVVELMAGLEPLALDADWVAATTAAWRAEWAAQAADDGAVAPLHPVAVVDAVCAAMPEDTLYVTGEGNVDMFADARLRISGPKGYLRVGQAGALGPEIPYGIGAKFVHPERPVVVFVGDGGVGYHGVELDTAERYGRPIIVVVQDDASWGAIALPQVKDYGAAFDTDLPSRDWARFAEALGCFGARAESVDQIGPAVRAAHASGKPAIVQVPVRSVLSPFMDFVEF
ncbi:MAG: thiamine pyrophosphate-binding protein [Alphaproteobacteria bacterium]|nr:thiamine pyrophosphate-binding protein [Alphaproteobacteria bacterium]